MQILHLISGLKSGGAESVLYKLIKHDKFNSHHVVTFSGGFYLNQLKKINVKVSIKAFSIFEVNLSFLNISRSTSAA